MPASYPIILNHQVGLNGLIDPGVIELIMMHYRVDFFRTIRGGIIEAFDFLMQIGYCFEKLFFCY